MAARKKPPTKAPLVIEQAYFLEAPVPDVYRALTDPKGLAGWFLAKADMPAQKGEEYQFWWQGGYHHRGLVLERVKNRRLSLSWPNTYRGETKETRVTFALSKKGRGTLLRLRHTGYPAATGWIDIYGATQSG
ncbi:MAG: SRPBCC domain-containing protein, partial [Thermoplasmata archaeon]